MLTLVCEFKDTAQKAGGRYKSNIEGEGSRSG